MVMVMLCLEAMVSLALTWIMTQRWVPGHRVVEGTEVADRLAREGASLPYLGPDPTFGFHFDDVIGFLNHWVETRKVITLRCPPRTPNPANFFALLGCCNPSRVGLILLSRRAEPIRLKCLAG